MDPKKTTAKQHGALPIYILRRSKDFDIVLRFFTPILPSKSLPTAGISTKVSSPQRSSTNRKSATFLQIYQICWICRLSAKAAICGFAICRSNLFCNLRICDLRTHFLEDLKLKMLSLGLTPWLVLQVLFDVI